MGLPEKEKRKSTLKAFGNFIAMHMVKKLVRRNKNGLNKHDKDAIDAGFSATSEENGYSNGNGSAVHHTSTGTNGNGTTNGKSSTGSKSYNGLLNGFDLSSINSMPGVVGLTNHGNTCFMNSIVQCLSNTDVLAEYFVLGQYKNDLKNCRKDRSKKYGTKGEVIELLASVVRSLWTVTYSQDMTKSLKDSISKYGAQYKGSNQHDSQEFMLWLFDKMHEDLNMQPVKKRSFTRRPSFRKSVSRKPSENGKGIDDVGAATKLAVDLSPTSFIQKLFQGHYRSSLTCPNCKKRSDTTDPFLCVSLPLKQRTTRPMYANVVYLPNKRRSGIGRRHMAGKTIKIGVSVPLDGKIIDLRQAVAAECGIHSRLLAFVDLQHDGFHKAYGDDYSLSDFPINNSSTTAANMSLYAFEMPPIAKMTAGTLPRNFASSHKKRATLGGKFGKEGNDATSATSTVADSIVVILINKQGVREQGKRFGRPLVFRASRDVLSTELQCMILNQMSDQLKNGVKHERMGSLFRLQVKDGIPNKSYLSQQAQQPLRLPTVDKALENCPAGGPLHIKLVAEWDTDTKCGIFEKFPEEKVEVQDSVRLQKVLHQQPVTCTLEECFDLHTQVEELGADNAWLCPHCKKQQQGTVKKLSLLTLPDILVLHLKRFRVTDGRRTKLCTRVEFPVTGLNMSKHIFSSGEMNGHISPQSPKSYNWNPAFASHLPEMVGPEDHLYDLYAVCNHFGNLNSGHYTACCSNPLNGKWYLFDDTHTEGITEDTLSPQSVYILFYQRRSASAALSCGGASINTVMSDHWAFQLPQFKHKVQFNSQSQLNHHSVMPVNRVKTFSVSRSTTTEPAPVDNHTAMKINSNNNSNKIAAAASKLQAVKRKEERRDEADDGGFDSPNRPYLRGLRRQGSAIVGKPREDVEDRSELRGRQYRSYRHSRNTRRQQSSHV